jgi:predicted transposase/invertase (TIGR01784 family)
MRYIDPSTIIFKAMTLTNDRYINLFTDFGFKKLFGEAPNKDLLISFLNELLHGKEIIEDLSYLKNERLGNQEGERRAVYDLYCTNEKGEKIIIEIQRVKQQFFKDRSVYYSSFAIQDQAIKGKDWKYEMAAVYTIAIMDFTFDNANPDKYEHRIKLIDEQTHEVFYDKLTYLYLEIPKFRKALHELENDYDRWLFAFKNLHRLREMPKELEQGIFKRLFELAEIARMDSKERSVYEDSLKDYRDLKSAMDTYFQDGYKGGFDDGFEGGKKEREKEIARQALQKGLSVELVMELTGLSRETIEKLQ